MSSQVTEKLSFMTMFNEKRSWLIWKNLLSLPQRQSFMEKVILWDHYSMIRFDFSTFNAGLYLQEL